MKRTILLFIYLTFYQLAIGQNFQEICENSITNGTIVDCQFFEGTLYSVGFFNIICDETTNYVAEWDNGTWQPSAINISDPGHSLTVINDKLYIAKYEENIDSNWVYVYDNSEVEKVGEGVYLTTASGFSELPNIYDIIEFEGDIIACGEFDKVGDKFIQGIMKYDGSSWDSLGLGLSGNIQGSAPVLFPHQMIVHNSELYVVGNFRYAGDEQVNGVAKWDGNTWTSMGNGFNGTVYSITVFEDKIIAGGSFTESNGTPINRIAQWNGTNWMPLSFGFSQPSMNDFIFVHTLKVIDDVLYVAGGLKEITYEDNTSEVCNGIMSYFNNTINTFSGGVPNNDVEAICKLGNDQLIIGGGVFGNGYSGITNISTNTTEQKIENAQTTIFPNPFNDHFSIITKENYIKYEIVNSAGLTMKTGIFENSLELDLNPGLYFLKLITGANSYSIHKIIKY